MNRRNFIGTSLAAGLAATASAQTAPQPPLPKRSKITSSVMLWTLKGSFEDKVETAARAGMQSVELVGEHSKWTDPQIEQMKKFVRSFGMGMDTILAQQDWGKRPVTMVDPAHREGFLADVRQALVFADKLEIPQIILMGGNTIPGKSYDEQYASIVEGAKRAGELAMKAEKTLIFEPLNNKVDHKGYFLATCTEGLRMIKDVDNPRVKLLFDIYHEQVQTGNVIRTITEAEPLVAVFHIADNPGRNDPGTGEMNYANIYQAIKKTGYAGYITMEYLPIGDQVASLKKSVDHMRAHVV